MHERRTCGSGTTTTLGAAIDLEGKMGRRWSYAGFRVVVCRFSGGSVPVFGGVSACMDGEVESGDIYALREFMQSVIIARIIPIVMCVDLNGDAFASEWLIARVICGCPCRSHE